MKLQCDCIDEAEKWILQLKIGDIVCDCRYKHLAIVKIIDKITLCCGKMWNREVELSDGAYCSVKHCCDNINDCGCI
jgi:hypothetical protein